MASKITPTDGETFIAAPSQSAQLTVMDFMTPHRIRLSTTGRPVFVHGTTGTEYKSASAFCKAVFVRKGKTNEWAGPKHIFVMRDGNWVSLKGILASVKA